MLPTLKRYLEPNKTSKEKEAVLWILSNMINEHADIRRDVAK